jgi:neutral ceramidase
MPDRMLSVCLLWMGVVLSTGVLQGADGQLKVGAAQVEITPPVGFPMAGYYHERLATGKKDPLWAKAVVWEQGETKAAFVGCDLTGISFDLTSEVRQRVAAQTGIPHEAIILSGTHSHTAPDYGRDLYRLLGSQGVAAAAEPPYSARLIEAVTEAIVRAHQRLKPATVSISTARQQVPVSFNRRFVMKDGSVKTWQSLSTPGVVRAAGPIDPELGLAVIRDATNQKPIAACTNFALHLDTVGGLEWSADYPYFIEQALHRELGPEVVSVFGLGCCGDINHSNPASKDRNKTDFIGNSLGATAVSALPLARRIDTPRLRFVSEVVRLPLKQPSVAEIRQSRELLKAIQGGHKAEFLEQVAAYRLIMLDLYLNREPQGPPQELISTGLSHRLAGIGAELPVEVQALCLGEDLAFVFLPGEVFVELGLAIKQGSPFRQTHVVELSNFVETFYVPNRAAYAQGSYEVTNSALQPGGGELLVEAALRLLRRASETTVPSTP